MKSETFLGLVDDLDDNTLQAITPKSVLAIQTVTLFQFQVSRLLGEYPNTYIFTKCITEDLVKTSLQVPKAIMRPAIGNFQPPHSSNLVPIYSSDWYYRRTGTRMG
jgi:fatty acyl-CoA reductase